MLLVPVLYVNQEMVARLGAVTGVGHARLILERFGKFWGAFSVVDLFILNALTIVTEFIGINLALGYLGVPRVWGIAVAAGIIIAAASTGSFRRFERFSLALCFLSLLLVPIFVMAHPPLAEIGRGLIVPQFPSDGKLSDVMLLVIAIVGTTIAPWQLFFQQSYVIDKRIPPRFMAYEKADLAIGIGVVLAGAIAIMAFAAAAFQGTSEFGQFTDAGALAKGLEAYAGRSAGVMFALALLDASIIGASAVSLATAYAIGDVLALRHSLHRKATDARGFNAVYAGLIVTAAALVLLGSDALLGLLTTAVQTLAGVLLPSATVFLLLLCNDREVLGPWVNGRWLNLFTGAVIWVLVMLSMILTSATAFPDMSGETILAVLGGGIAVGIAGFAVVTLLPRRGRSEPAVIGNMIHPDRLRSLRATWRMPALVASPAPKLSLSKRPTSRHALTSVPAAAAIAWNTCPPRVTRMPAPATRVGTLPIIPQAMIAASNTASAATAAQPKGEVRVISRLSCSGEASRSSATLRKICSDAAVIAIPPRSRFRLAAQLRAARDGLAVLTSITASPGLHLDY